MEKTSVQKLARVIRVLIIIVFVCDIIALLLVPGMARLSFDGGIETLVGAWHHVLSGEEFGFGVFPAYFVWSWVGVWPEAPCAVLTVFLWVCGICAAVILLQGKRVLDTILKEETFSFSNAASMKRAAVCCFVISAAALVRLVWGMAFYHSVLPLISYNALFVPVFLVAGLICLVMSALFRQAAEMKAEQDLTI